MYRLKRKSEQVFEKVKADIAYWLDTFGANQYLRSSLSLSSQTIVAQVKTGLTQQLAMFDSGEDARGVFTTAYEIATNSILAKVAETGGFDDPHWLAALAERFAWYYFEASAAYDDAQKRDKLPEVWAKAFGAIGAGRPVWQHAWQATTLEALVLPLIVHTVHDLPLAVADLLLRIKDPQTHIHDFEKINRLIIQEIPHVQVALGLKYNWLLLHLDCWAGWYDEFLTYHLLRLLRSAAWYNATRLVEARKEQLRLAYQIKAVQTKLKTGRKQGLLETEAIAQLDRYAAQLAEADRRHQQVQESIVGLTQTYLDVALNPPWPLKVGLIPVRLISGFFRLALMIAVVWSRRLSKAELKDSIGLRRSAATAQPNSPKLQTLSQ